MLQKFGAKGLEDLNTVFAQPLTADEAVDLLFNAKLSENSYNTLRAALLDDILPS